MTICIAAIAEEKDKEYIVFATDHMITTAMGQFEHSIVKYRKINENTVAMLAGEALIFDELIKLKKQTVSFNDIRETIFLNIKQKRKDVIKNEIFDLFGIDATFITECLRSQIPNPILGQIMEKVATYRLNTGILLIGYDENNKAQIVEINETGIVSFRSINFHAIGSGASQAANTLLFQKHAKNDSLASTVYDVYKAKRNAEVSEGVGKETEVLVLNTKGCSALSSKEIDLLSKVYYDELKYGRNNKKLAVLNKYRG